jgi:tRNA pseudouridine32 synthase/23S rRNA pseudouridine746 synthase
MSHMLVGLDVEANPIAKNYGSGKDIKIIYEDDDLLIVNKPEGLLSVPGKVIKDSVFSRLKNSYPTFPELLLVHRLDMSTSGILVVAKHLKAHKYIQRQFIKRTVQKRYVALLDGVLNEEQGSIDLPMRVDLDNRPRQLICFEMGKPAVTEYKVIAIKNKKTRVHFFPKTGRTHQLRLHAAHTLGLQAPIIGDDLYGEQKDRLYLHAEEISFIHPSMRERVQFTAEADF